MKRFLAIYLGTEEALESQGGKGWMKRLEKSGRGAV